MTIFYLVFKNHNFMYKFEKLAQTLRHLIEQGTWQPHQRLPSLREQSQQSGYSLMTVLNAYQELEAQGLIYSKDKSGYYVEQKIDHPVLEPQIEMSFMPDIQMNSLVFDYLKATQVVDIIGLGSAFPHEDLVYQPKLIQILAKHARRKQSYISVDSMPPGHYPLQQIIARRYSLQGIATEPEDIVITSGCLDALNLSLQATTQAGDYILIQSTIFYGAWQAAERWGLKVITLPEHPEHGFDLELFEQCLQKFPIKVCWFMLNSHNPIGFTVSNDIKEKIAALLEKYDVYLIEDDVYQELFYGAQRPLSVKYFNQQRVLHCSSFSKTLGAGCRVGWVHSRLFSHKIQHLQLMSTLAVSPLLQHALAEFLTTHHYEKHLRQLRQQLERNKKQCYHYLLQHLPTTCTIYYFNSGYFLWVKLAKEIDSMALYRILLQQRISISPNHLFSIEQQQSQSIRLNCSLPWNDTTQFALDQLIKTIKTLEKNEA